MRVCEGHEVRGDGAVVGLFEARKGERARYEETRRRIRRSWRLMRMQGTAIVFGRSVLISRILRLAAPPYNIYAKDCSCIQARSRAQHLLGGNRLLLRAAKSLATSSAGRGIAREDAGSRSSTGAASTVAVVVAVDAWRQDAGFREVFNGRASLHKHTPSLEDSSRRAMILWWW